MHSQALVSCSCSFHPSRHFGLGGAWGIWSACRTGPTTYRAPVRGHCSLQVYAAAALHPIWARVLPNSRQNSVDAAVLSAVLRGLRSKPLNKEIQGATGVSPSTIYNGLRALTANPEFMSVLKSELIKVHAQAAANSGSQQLGDRYSPGSLTQQTRGDSSIPNNSSSPYHNTNSASTIASNTASLPQKSSPSRGIKTW